MPAVTTRSSSGQGSDSPSRPKLRRTRVSTSPTRASLGSPPCCSIAPTEPARTASWGARPEDLHGAGGRSQEAEDGVDDGGLAGAVRTEEGDGLAGGDLQVQVVDGEHVAVADREAGDGQGRGSGHATSVARRGAPAVVRDVAGPA